MVDKYRFEIFEKVDPLRWNSELKKSSLATFSQTVEYVTTKTYERIPLFVYVFDVHGEVKAQLALSIIKKHNSYSTQLLRRYTEIISKLGYRCSWVGGPIIHSDDEKDRLEILKVMLSSLDYISKKYNIIIMDGYTTPEDIISDRYLDEFREKSFSVENFLTFRTNLVNDIENIWNNIEKSARNDVTKSERQKVTIQEIETIEQLKKFSELAQIWAPTKGIKIKDHLEHLEDDWNHYESGIERFFLAYQENNIISGLRIGTFNGIAYTNQVLNSYSKASSVGGPALTWHAIKWAKEVGMRVYDFSGVLAPNTKKNDKEYSEQWEGLTKYKQKWGGNEYPYYHFIRVINPPRYKLFRLLTKPDWYYRNYKRKHFVRPKKTI